MKPSLSLLTGLFLLLITWLFVGVSRDAEFNEPSLFLKHRPSFRIHFYSPCGMSDLTIQDLPKPEQADEKAFEEFVLHHYDFQENTSLLTFMLIQLTLTFLSFGLFNVKGRKPINGWQMIAHFIICLFFNSILIFFILAFDQFLTTVILSIILIGINYWIFILTSLFKERKP